MVGNGKKYVICNSKCIVVYCLFLKKNLCVYNLKLNIELYIYFIVCI